MMVEAAVTELKLKLPVLPEIGVVLGSGLGSFADEIEYPTVIPYADIPHWPASTVVEVAKLARPEMLIEAEAIALVE